MRRPSLLEVAVWAITIAVVVILLAVTFGWRR